MIYIKHFVLVVLYYVLYNLMLYYGSIFVEQQDISFLPFLDPIVFGTLLLLLSIYYKKNTLIDKSKPNLDCKTLILVIVLGFFYKIIEDPIYRFNQIIGNSEIPDIKPRNINYAVEISVIISTVFFIPILEELLFRGIILRKLTLSKGKLVSLMFSAFLFMLIHINVFALEKSIPNVITSLIFGLIVGFVYLKTNRLIYCIALHFLNNLLWYIFRVKADFYWGVIEYYNFNYMYFILVIFSCGALFTILRSFKNNAYHY